MARSADSRPEPGPETSTSSVRMPCSAALRTASSAAIWAANGVDLREPLKPIVPADDHEIVLPCASVMVIIVLLNVEFTWATPETMFLRSRRRTRVASFAMRLSFDRARQGARSLLKWVGTKRRSLLLAGDGLRLALAGAGVGVGALAAHRQLLAMAQTPIGAQVHQALDVDCDFAAKVALHHVVAIDRFADLHHFRVRELRDAPLGGNVHLLDDLLGLLRPDPMDILERDHDALVGGNIDACYASHSLKRSISAAVRRKAERRGTIRLDVRWRPALVENPQERKKSHTLEGGAGTQNGFRMTGI